MNLWNLSYWLNRSDAGEDCVTAISRNVAGLTAVPGGAVGLLDEISPSGYETNWYGRSTLR
jgi:hypothetical protein